MFLAKWVALSMRPAVGYCGAELGAGWGSRFRLPHDRLGSSACAYEPCSARASSARAVHAGAEGRDCARG